MRFFESKNNGGFTLFEVVMVLVLIGIFTTVAIVQHAETDPSLIVQVQVLKSHIRYAQMRSMNSDTGWGIQYIHGANPGDPYYELDYGDPSNRRIAALPGETDLRVALGSMDIAIVAAIGGNLHPSSDFRLSFDSWGRPSIDGDLPSGDIILRLTKPGHDDEQLTVTRNTGFIP